MVFYQKRHLSLKESLDKHLESLPWAESGLIERKIPSGCSLDACREALLHNFPESQVGHAGPKGDASKLT